MKSLFFSIVFSMLLVGSANAGLLRDLFGPNDDQRCQSYGFRPSSQGYAQCSMTLDIQRQQERKNAIRDFGNAMERAGRSVQTNSPTTCHTSYFGWTATTTCY
jgi:hypothetical protein